MSNAGKMASVGAALAALVLVTGCSSGSSGSGGSTVTSAAGTAAATTSAAAPSAPATSTAGSATAAATAVTATLKEFSITLSTSTFTAGTYTFSVVNTGSDPHNLTIEGPGVDKAASPTLAAGKSATVTVTFQKGSYELWCSVANHKAMGMDMTIQVT